MTATIPPLAGLCTYDEAGRTGYSVEETVARLVRYAWLEKRAMEVGLAWLAPTPEWEVKEALGLHLSLDAEHVASLRKRIGEMRSPIPPMDVSPDGAIDTFFTELLCAQDTLEKMCGLYAVLRQALLDAYRQHYAHTHPIADYPTRRLLRQMLADTEESVAWGQQAIAALVQTAEDAARAHTWQAHLLAYLAASGGVMGAETRPASVPPSLSQSGGHSEQAADFFPQRDERFALRWNFVNPQRQVSLDEHVPLDERTLALMCRRVVEMDVPEYMSRIIALAEDEPWEYYVAMTRQLWDEVRHAMLGAIYFEQRGIAWRQAIAIHPGMSMRMNSLDVKDAHLVLFAIEQNLMPGRSGKRLEYEISRNAQDALAAQIQDYDWADEVLHAQIGRKWLLPKLGMQLTEAVQRGVELRAGTVGVLDQYSERAEQTNWWPHFVVIALGHETAVEQFELTRR